MKVSISFESTGADQTIGQTRQIQQSIASVGNEQKRNQRINEEYAKSVAGTANSFASVRNSAASFSEAIRGTVKSISLLAPLLNIIIDKNKDLDETTKNTLKQALRATQAMNILLSSKDPVTKLIRATGILSGDINKLIQDNQQLDQRAKDSLQGIINKIQAINKIPFLPNIIGSQVASILGLNVQKLDELSGRINQINTLSQKQGIADLAFKYNNVVQAVQSLAAAAKPAYDLLIGQNEKLNQQLLGTRANLVATNKIVSDGAEITDPTQAIQALDEPVKNAVAQIREASLDVVGVTSSQLIETFNILTSQAANLTNQSKELPDAISAASKLTTDFAAALGTIGLPLGQARQEISSILTGTVDMNSVLAKQLGITNQQVQQWKAQGVLVDELRERLRPFVEGNKLAARSIAGITSNIQEVLEITTQAAGEPLLEPLVNSLDELYQFLKENQEELQNFSQDAILKFLSLAQAVGDAAMRIGDVLLPAIQDLQPSAEIFADTFVTGLKVSADGVANLVEVLQPLIQGLIDLTNIATEGFEQAQNNLAELAGTAELSQEAIQAYAGVTESLIGQATKSIKEQKAALELRNKADKDKIQLTKEQVEIETNARKSAQQVIADLKNQRKELVQLSVVGTENKIALKGQIRDLDTYINTLERQSKGFKTSITNIQVQAKSLDTLGKG